MGDFAHLNVIRDISKNNFPHKKKRKVDLESLKVNLNTSPTSFFVHEHLAGMAMAVGCELFQLSDSWLPSKHSNVSRYNETFATNVKYMEKK